MTEIFGIGFSVFVLLLAGYMAYRNSQKIGSVYTRDKQAATYGIHRGYIDEGLTDAIRDRVYEKHGEECGITGRDGFRGDADTNGQHLLVGVGLKVELQIGHIIPRKLGGPTEPWNLIPMEAKLNNILKDKVTPMAERLCRERKEMIWHKGIKKTTFEAEKKKLARKKDNSRCSHDA